MLWLPNTFECFNDIQSKIEIYIETTNKIESFRIAPQISDSTAKLRQVETIETIS